jgi:hypothetical protein
MTDTIHENEKRLQKWFSISPFPSDHPAAALILAQNFPAIHALAERAENGEARAAKFEEYWASESLERDKLEADLARVTEEVVELTESRKNLETIIDAQLVQLAEREADLVEARNLTVPESAKAFAKLESDFAVLKVHAEAMYANIVVEAGYGELAEAKAYAAWKEGQR